MRKAGKVLAQVLEDLPKEVIHPGISTLEISLKAEELIRSFAGCYPAFLGYHGFPHAACVSVNTYVVHTTPSDTCILKSGDIVSIDCGVLYNEHYSDACRTYIVEETSPAVERLVRATEEALNKGIQSALGGNRVGDISFSIQKHLERNGLQFSLDFVGHGIGKVLHGNPQVPNYGPPNQGPILIPGQCLAIEPVVFNGSTEVLLAEDGWSVYSKHGNLSAHFEDTILITESTPEILTRL